MAEEQHFAYLRKTNPTTMKRFLSTCFGIAAMLSLSAQCSVIEVPLTQRASAATLIVEGKVSEQHSFWNSSHNMIYTANVIELYKIFKGDVATTHIEVITEGGTVGMDKIVVEPTLELEVGQEGMFTCVPVARAQNISNARNMYPQFEAYASLQGFVKYDAVSHTAADPFRTYTDLQNEVYNVCAPAGHHQYTEVKVVDVMHNAERNAPPQQVLAPLTINNFAPTTVTAGTGTTITINGAGFGSVQGTGVVRFRNADDGGATTVTPLPSQYISWTTTQIIVEVPQNAGTGTIEVFQGSTATSTGTLTISYAHLNVDFDPGSGVIAYQTDHINDNGSGGYTWRMNTAFSANAAANASFMRAFESWRCNTLVNWSIGSTTSINDAVSDGTNIICFDNTAPLSAGILGVCYSYWSGCASGPTIVWYVNELDIIFDEGSNISPLTWEFGPSLPSGSEYDFETVAVHELGHGHQLGHVIAPGAIMHYAISNGTSNRSLGANDLAGGQFVQSKSTTSNVCGPGAMSNFFCGTPPVAAFSGTPTTICEGGSVSFTDQSTGTPTSWSWIFPGGSPASSNAQNPTVSYSTPGTYNVSLTATNASGSNSVTMTGYITVNAAPSVGFNASPALTVCAGEQVTLSGTGASSYAWTGGITNGVPFTAATTTTYTVTGTAASGCTSTAIATVTVASAPSLSVVSNPVNGIVCTGNQATLTASGAQSYLWSGGITNGVAFTPPATTTYTVTGTDANGCTATAQSTITVQNCSFQTQLNSTWCGATNVTLSQTIVANTVSGATNYQFWFQNTTLGYSQTRIKGNGIANIPLSWISGLQYNTTYEVRVRCYINGQWQAYGPMCTLTTAASIPSPQLTNCAMTNCTYSTLLTVNSIAGAQDYCYEITNAQQPLTSTVYRGSATPSIGVSWLTGIQYGRTYDVRVRVKVGNVWGPYGSTCTFTMQAAAPTTQLTTLCNASGLTTTTTLAWSSVTGASNYRVNITNATTGYNQTKLKGNNGTTMGLSQFTGLQNNTTYTVMIATYIGGTWNAYGPACTITIGSVVRLENPDAAENTAFNFGVSMYPNPIGTGVNPFVTITGADQQEAMVTIMDLTGRVITTYQLFVEGNSYTTELTGFPDLVSGMYIMQVQVGEQVESKRFVAQ
jgi:PKD repeat protein